MFNTKPNSKQIMAIILFALLIGQFIRVGYYTYDSWTREISDENCVTVDDEYFLRATKGLNYTYNQIYITELEKCKTQT